MQSGEDASQMITNDSFIKLCSTATLFRYRSLCGWRSPKIAGLIPTAAKVSLN